MYIDINPNPMSLIGQTVFSKNGDRHCIAKYLGGSGPMLPRYNFETCGGDELIVAGDLETYENYDNAISQVAWNKEYNHLERIERMMSDPTIDQLEDRIQELQKEREPLFKAKVEAEEQALQAREEIRRLEGVASSLETSLRKAEDKIRLHQLWEVKDNVMGRDLSDDEVLILEHAENIKGGSMIDLGPLPTTRVRELEKKLAEATEVAHNQNWDFGERVEALKCLLPKTKPSKDEAIAAFMEHYREHITGWISAGLVWLTVGKDRSLILGDSPEDKYTSLDDAPGDIAQMLADAGVTEIDLRGEG